MKRYFVHIVAEVNALDTEDKYEVEAMMSWLLREFYRRDRARDGSDIDFIEDIYVEDVEEDNQ
jgi:hypothetical protein